MHVLVTTTRKKLMFLMFWMTNYNYHSKSKAMFESCMCYVSAFFMHPFIFIPLGTCLAWLVALKCCFLCLFVVGFIVGPCQDVGIAPRHQWAYFCTAAVGGICFLISKIRPPVFTTPWFTIPFFLVMGLYLSWMLSDSEEEEGRED